MEIPVYTMGCCSAMKSESQIEYVLNHNPNHRRINEGKRVSHKTTETYTVYLKAEAQGETGGYPGGPEIAWENDILLSPSSPLAS